jgi:hypothetical protein
MSKKINTSQYDAFVQNAAKPVILEFGADW